MSEFAQRALALVGAALLAGVLALALADRGGSRSRAGALPEPVGTPGGAWYEALAGVDARGPRRSACGYRLTSTTLGVAHPVLPCGARLYVLYRGRQALTQVVDRGPAGPGRELDLTPALGKLLRMRGVRRVRWAYAR